MRAISAAFAFLAAIAAGLDCTGEDGCSMNGVCVDKTRCECDPGWKGDDCSVLARLPRPRNASAAAYGFDPNVTSWGGNIILGDDGLFHLFVAEMADDVGSFCGLKTWTSHSRVVHATAASPLGPFEKRDVALPQQAHNPSPVRGLDGRWYLFHIGSASGNPVSNCSEPDLEQHQRSAPNDMSGDGGRFLHIATSPFGPWKAMPNLGCNNPAPLQHPNGTWFVGCNNGAFVIYRSDDPEKGNWVQVSKLEFPASWGVGEYIKAEDPYLFFDKRGRFHFIAHRYDYRDGWPPNPNQTNPVLVSGHGFSADGFNWYYNDNPPYPSQVTFDDGTVQYFATMERPHLIFDKDGHPTHLLNGVSPVWDEKTPCHQCDARPGTEHSCVVCKTSPGYDWTYTLTQPLA